MRHFFLSYMLIAAAVPLLAAVSAISAASQTSAADEEFGPVVRAYLGYLRNEQEVVDDRASRHEVNQAYYRHNSNRIRALRQVAIRIARESRNDYLPELEAVSRGELGLLFEKAPRPEVLREGEVLRGTFRFLGVVRAGESFYVFARLDPYEQAELAERGHQSTESSSGQKSSPPSLTRAKRATSP